MSNTPHYDPEEEPVPKVPRNSRGGLPLWIILICLLLVALGFWLFQQWRGQYVDYSDTFGSLAVMAGQLGTAILC